MSLKKNLEKQVESKNQIANDERNERCVPIAVEVIKMFGALEQHELVSQDKSKTFETYSNVAHKILELLLDKNLPVGEYGYVNQLVLKGWDEVNSIVVQSLDKHLNTLQEKTFGSRLFDMPMQTLHAKLIDDKLDE